MGCSISRDDEEMRKVQAMARAAAEADAVSNHARDPSRRTLYSHYTDEEVLDDEPYESPVPQPTPSPNGKGNLVEPLSSDCVDDAASEQSAKHSVCSAPATARVQDAVRRLSLTMFGGTDSWSDDASICSNATA